jgi:hypothetical protein
MPTVNKEIATAIMANNGYYTVPNAEDQDPRVIAIVTYDNMFNGNKEYAICYYYRQLQGYLNSPACHDPKVVWITTDTYNYWKADVAAEEEFHELIIGYHTAGDCVFAPSN